MSPTHLAIESAAQEVEKLLNGQLLIALVNNASGVTNLGPVQRFERENFGKQIQVNLFGTRNVTNTFLPYLGASFKRPSKQKLGKIININSISGIFNTPINETYYIAKHAFPTSFIRINYSLKFFPTGLLVVGDDRMLHYKISKKL